MSCQKSQEAEGRPRWWSMNAEVESPQYRRLHSSVTLRTCQWDQGEKRPQNGEESRHGGTQTRPEECALYSFLELPINGTCCLI